MKRLLSVRAALNAAALGLLLTGLMSALLAQAQSMAADEFRVTLLGPDVLMQAGG